MKVPVSWLRELADVQAGAEEIGSALHLVGFELAGIEQPVSPSCPVPADVGPLLERETVIDLEITANRPDCLGMAGIAREVATRFDVSILYEPATFDAPPDPAFAHPLRVTIEAPDLCPRYTSALAEVKVGPSPAWLVARLAAVGVRSINNIVDVTNYVLMETGHPIHAFDLETLAGTHLRIRRASPDERIKTLDGTTRTLESDMLVIADAARAQAVAGVMGGAESEVTASTRVIAIESAYFQPASVRRTSKRLGLSTEASHRFERGADLEAPPRALARACQLIEQIGAGKRRSAWIDAYPVARMPARVVLRLERIRRVLGFDVAPEVVERILRGLGFSLDDARNAPGPAWQVTAPSWRVDIAREIDLVEEVARHHGYDRVPTSFPALTVPPPGPDARLTRDATVRAFMRGAGFSESVTFSFVPHDTARRYADDGSLVTIANPLSESFAVMRPMLLPGLVDSVSHNRRREQRDVRLFELATRFARDGGERRAVALAWTGHAGEPHWSGGGREVDLFDITGVVSALAGALGLTTSFRPASSKFLLKGTSAEIDATPRANRETGVRSIGIVGQLDTAIAEAHGLPSRESVLVAEIDLDAVADWTDLGERVRAVSLPPFPSIVRDISISVPIDLPAAAVRGTIRRTAPATLERVREFDRYHGKGVPEGRYSLSLRLTFRAPDRTLTDAEVQQAMDAIVAALVSEHDATLR